MRGQCDACGYSGIVDRAHFRTRGSGAGWLDHEYCLLCRRCHVASGAQGWSKFIERNPSMEEVLEKKGWEITEEFGIKKLRRIE